jgi:hypothetical protein
MTTPVSDAFDHYLRERSERGDAEPGETDVARQFWAMLAPLGDSIDTRRLVDALETLVEQAPHHCHPITD